MTARQASPWRDWLFAAIRRAVLRYVPRRVAEILAIVFGLWAMLLPLALWVSWTREIFVGVLASGFLSCCMCIVFAIATSSPNAKRGRSEIWRQSQRDFDRLRNINPGKGWREHT